MGREDVAAGKTKQIKGKINDAVTSRERSGDHECADADMG